MPGETPEMFDWWFAWHGLEDMRYRIWDPEDHFYARQQMPEKVLDPKVPMKEKHGGLFILSAKTSAQVPTIWF